MMVPWLYHPVYDQKEKQQLALHLDTLVFIEHNVVHAGKNVETSGPDYWNGYWTGLLESPLGAKLTTKMQFS